MKTWKTEKTRLQINGVEFPKPTEMTPTEKVEILVKINIFMIFDLDSSRHE